MIFYFSGTGNSLMAAKALADEDEKIVDMAAARKEQAYDYDLAGERMGFVFPCYFFTLPQVVSDFVEHLQATGVGYVFIVVTCGGSSGGTGALLAKKLAALGIASDYVTSLLMPDNAIFFYKIESKKETDAILEKSIEELATIKKDLREEMKKKGKRVPSAIFRPIYRMFSKTKAFSVTSDCIHCGLCVKNCPEEAIVAEKGRPVWVKKNCVMCSACINRCPTAAIQYGKRTQGGLRYVNPILKGEDRF